MKLLIISDTHGNNSNVIKVIDNIRKKIDIIIHLGDCEKDSQKLSKSYAEIPLYIVSGNSDFNSSALTEQILEFNGSKILITHGHKYNVKWNYDNIYYAAKQMNVQAVLFGHTHSPIIEYRDSVLLMNPGSISLPRDTAIPSYGIIDINDSGVLKPSIVGIFGKNDYRIIEFYQ